jgi:hypothetical protein
MHLDRVAVSPGTMTNENVVLAAYPSRIWNFVSVLRSAAMAL